jgi:hypothetical protein
MPDPVAPGAAPPIAVSPDNPCPFLRALVANGYVGGHTVPLPELCRNIEAASGEHGMAKQAVGVKTYMVALGANGIGPQRLIESAKSGAVLDELRNGPLDKHGAGSRILDATAQVREDEIERLATFGKDCTDPAGGTERGLTGREIETFMAANLKRAGSEARFYYPLLMKGEWPVLLNIMGKGKGEARYLSVAEVRTLFVERRFPDRIVALLQQHP